MPRFYFVGICLNSSLDQRSNNFSLHQLIEQLQTAPLPGHIPLETHVYVEFDEVERGRPHELRILIEDAQGAVSWTSRRASFTPVGARHRLVSQGVFLPGAGYFHLAAEIRPAGDEAQPWTRSPTAWPLEVSLAESAEAPPAPPA